MKLIRKKILNWRKGHILVEPLTSIICDVKWEKNLTFKTVKYSFVYSLRFFGYKPIKKLVLHQKSWTIEIWNLTYGKVTNSSTFKDFKKAYEGEI